MDSSSDRSESRKALSRIARFLCVPLAVVVIGLIAPALPASARTLHGPHRITATPLISTGSGGVTPFSSTGCSSSVCIHIEGSGDDVEWITVYNGSGDALPLGSAIYLLYGSSPSSATVLETAYVTYSGQYGEQWNFYRSFASYYWFCGELSALPGKPCEQILP